MAIVLVIGAGASRALVHTPLGTNLVWTYWQDSHPFADTPRYSKFLQLAEKLFPEFRGEANKFLSMQKECMIYFAPEERLRKCHYVDDMLRSLKGNSEEEGEKLLQQLILKHIVSVSNEHHRGYDQFKKHVLGMPNISVVALNFDTYLNEGPPGPKLDYRVHFDWIDPNRCNYSSGKGIPLLKLNGSLDWAVCSQGHLTLLNYSITERTFPGGRCHVQLCNNTIAPLLVTPHLEHDSVFAGLWKEAEEVLARAEKVVIIGYSFPHYDTRVIELFQRSLKGSIVVEVIDMKMCDELEEDARCRIQAKYQGLFPNLSTNQLTIHSEGLEKYLQRVCP